MPIKRHTSFAAVYVSPVMDENIEIEINPSDIKVDTFQSRRSWRAVNKVETAIRITSAFRYSGSSARMKDLKIRTSNAMKMLKSKLYMIEKKRNLQDFRQLKVQRKNRMGKPDKVTCFILIIW